MGFRWYHLNQWQGVWDIGESTPKSWSLPDSWSISMWLFWRWPVLILYVRRQTQEFGFVMIVLFRNGPEIQDFPKTNLRSPAHNCWLNPIRSQCFWATGHLFFCRSSPYFGIFLAQQKPHMPNMPIMPVVSWMHHLWFGGSRTRRRKGLLCIWAHQIHGWGGFKQQNVSKSQMIYGNINMMVWWDIWWNVME